MRILRLFPDTNVFLQCKNLNELDWSPWSEFDEIHVVVCHLVQREIDRRKAGQNDRTTKRARRTASLLRRVILAESKDHVIHDGSPRVILIVDHKYSHSPTLNLDYALNDNQLVGTVHAASDANPKDDIRLLTHDAFPLATAHGLGLKADVVPDEWLLPPEATKHDKRMRELEAELESLRSQEPRCTIEWRNVNGTDTRKIEGEHSHFPALRDIEIRQLLQQIEAAFPVKSDFGPSSPPRRNVARIHSSLLGLQEEFIPASEKEIEKYRSDYAAWLDGFSRIFAKYHSGLQRCSPPHRVLLSLKNIGSRPATDVLVTLSVSGHFQIAIYESHTTHVDRTLPTHELASHLKKNPIPPRGHWSLPKRFTAHLAHMRALNRTATIQNRPVFDPISDFRIPDVVREADRFYFRDGDLGTPQRYVRMECDQWRHGHSEESLVVELRGVGSSGVRGLISCRVEAANLARSVTKRIPVDIAPKPMDTLSQAEQDLDSALRSVRSAQQSPKAKEED